MWGNKGSFGYNPEEYLNPVTIKLPILQIQKLKQTQRTYKLYGKNPSSKTTRFSSKTLTLLKHNTFNIISAKLIMYYKHENFEPVFIENATK